MFVRVPRYARTEKSVIEIHREGLLREKSLDKHRASEECGSKITAKDP